ncbi:hypothetical protein BKN14_02985 [Candidatus Gracilibacteria bacterium HOT-871]|nr:hypothetical protein BKN14_02985 [Candidatus Gracilibacteria bacterium HOT-871]MBB1564622.1 hypothetical protein [Candidatus Gracilibacteria bacterium]MBF0913726.1 hypothetical protein [Candidatus Gracilibacteria bacterium]RKW23180.1 MAG: hypothetical protein D8B46_03910 [Candidatus Gracilibacteria bacterium]
MSKIFFLIKLLINVLLYAFYGFISIIIGDFLYGAYLTYFLEKDVPGSGDIIHTKVAIFSCLFILIFTLIFRSFFYLSLFKSKK